MERFIPLLLDVWRQACREPHIDTSARAIAEVVGRRMPCERLLIRAVDAGQGRIETLADVRSGAAAPADSRPIPPLGGPPDLHALERWCLSGEILRGSAQQLRDRLPGVLPDPWDGTVLAGGLALDDQALGVLILGGGGGHYRREHEPMLAALCEPIAVALRNDRQLRELSSLREAAEADRRSLLARLGRQDIADTIVGERTGLESVMRSVDLVARAEAPVLILGETGTGKEVVARAIHARSSRSAGPFLRVNCGAIPPELADSELFGHERGSFTGATARRRGWFERADGGTLFLDEIGELTPAVQVRLLRILQDGSFERVGGQQTLHANVRLIAATNQDLELMVAAGDFRADLWYRIHVFPIRLPPLRERPADIPDLAVHFAQRAAQRLGLMPRAPDPAAVARLLAYHWPGNVRELAAVMERAAILGEGRRLAVAEALGNGAAPRAAVADGAYPIAAEPAEQTLDAATRDRIERALTRCLGRIEGPFGAARVLGVNPHTLRARMRKLGIDWARFRVSRD
ncbi:MAG: transcriptional regulator containing AAA-type ATPase, and binding domain [Chromatiaceae bacterium]|nr:transcriptional regulator containing AAA-type ATPase, and binding domain [Chromatiaceae bacterium]